MLSPGRENTEALNLWTSMVFMVIGFRRISMFSPVQLDSIWGRYHSYCTPIFHHTNIENTEPEKYLPQLKQQKLWKECQYELQYYFAMQYNVWKCTKINQLTMNYIHFWIYRFVKMSSPNLNNLIITGGVLVYCSVFISGLDTGLVDAGVKAIFCQVTGSIRF